MENEIKQKPHLKIDNIEFNDNTKIELKEDDIVVFVGSNNVGKSKTLKEIMNITFNVDIHNRILVKNIKFKEINFSVDALIKYIKECPKLVKQTGYENYLFQHGNNGYNFSINNSINDALSYYYKLFITFLNTNNRLDITNPMKLEYIENKNNFFIMENLETSVDNIKKLNEFLYNAFEKGIEISEEYLEFKLVKSYKIGNKEKVEKIIDLDKRKSKLETNKLESLDVQGDGIRSAVGILASLIVNDDDIVLIDEPESFLHPPQARLLGKNIVELSKEKQCFISTHNLDIIKGILNTNSERVKIIKIDRNENKNTFHLIDNETIKQISTDKNLKYTNILDGLFYNNTIICENESDCKFYSFILENINQKYFQETLFCAFGGKHQFKQIIPLINKLSINWKIISDMDLINDKDFLKAMINSISENKYDEIEKVHSTFIEEYRRQVNSQVKTRSIIKDEIAKILETGEKYITEKQKDDIIDILKNISVFKLLKNSGDSTIPTGECYENFTKLYNYLKENNIFILKCGEIEKFVPTIGGHGNKWLEKVFNEYPNFNDEIYDNARKFINEIIN